MIEAFTASPGFIGCIGTSISSLLKLFEYVGSLNPFLQLFVVGIAFSALFLGFKATKFIIWGS